MATVYVLEAVAQDRLGDQAVAEIALERSLELAEPDGLSSRFCCPLCWNYCSGTPRTAPRTHLSSPLIAEIRSLHAGAKPVPRPPLPGPPAEPLSGSEIRVLRYLPTNLTAPEIARELSVSPNTVRTHIKNLYA